MVGLVAIPLRPSACLVRSVRTCGLHPQPHYSQAGSRRLRPLL